MLHDWRDDVDGDIATSLIALIGALDAAHVLDHLGSDEDRQAIQRARADAVKWLACSWYREAAVRAGLLCWQCNAPTILQTSADGQLKQLLGIDGTTHVCAQRAQPATS